MDLVEYTSCLFPAIPGSLMLPATFNYLRVLSACLKDVVSITGTSNANDLLLGLAL